EELYPRLTLDQWGWDRANVLRGNDVGLKVCLQQIFQDYKKRVRQDKEGQEKAKEPIKVKLQERLGNIETYKNRLKKVKEDEIPFHETTINTLKEEIREIKRNPEDVMGDKGGKVAYYIGLVILIFITVYLFVFYSSASFSAFFKEFTSQAGVAASIFDPQALTNALSDGFFELVLITTIPFLFLGLGYLIDQFKNQAGFTKFIKIGALIFVTFIFDAILAYEITEKIERLNAEASFTETFNYSIAAASQSVSFWLIIFAGFVAYLIWGLVFSFVMEAYEKLDLVHSAVKIKKDEIFDQKQKISLLEVEKKKMEYLIDDNQTEVEKLRQILSQTHFIDYKEIENRLMQFLNGWLEWMNGNRKDENQQKSAHGIVEVFIQNNIKTNVDTEI
ncbi:MAG: hypothetical protein WD597_09165, partial [Balneolaceae bacterium]